jgi:nicotinate-nucleotide pyrophosphorylase (carboxylating)
MLSFDEQLLVLAKAAFKEDIGQGDHSSLSCIPTDVTGKAVLKIKQEGIIAGLEIAEKLFKFKEPSSQFIFFKSDADQVIPGEQGFEVKASVHTILQCERLVLNCIQRMSGIATLTRRYADRLKGYKTKLLDTRKTTPNFRLLEKEAVRIGGGHNHRFGLYDMIMLKDNHIDYCGSIEKAILRANDYRREFQPDLKIEIEARSVSEVKQIVKMALVDRILLDNFSPDQIKEALRLLDGQFETEASGGINLNNINLYAETGVDFISVGSLIHQAQSLDMSLKATVL